ncbi:hypothetical protein [Streptomyces sp. NPDC021562]|uniref:hypothetical protein n=1 Tax=Streptomyces sp. NPDC021562 TaxID=3155121 RepID=UPI0033E4D15E
MTEHASRIRSTTPAAQSGSAPTPRRAPGHEALRTALGEDGYQHLVHQRHERGTALGELGYLVLNTAAEADRLHGKLRRHAAHARDRLGELFNLRLDPAFVSVTGLLQNTGHTTDLHAARFAQQMNQLALVVESYQTVMRHTAGVTNRS